ncbi:DUF2271 domain-containing protein [Sphingobacterium thalpophilum]|uniref:DUF2271 domain-containing protein n=1 Tax=Sphingobacterium thalpophilum TaxID=259 RepID=A0A4U9W7J5_9SPHI|nr:MULTISPECIES: DUF2271 domain-containing protein [Sphingobacterium]VTR54779.1 Predicted periplasmic protein (DUF2271) [Sphingobacterium thalpophilum]
MNTTIKIALTTFLFSIVSVIAFAQTGKYKCMIQMNAYQGEKAYVIISLINPKGAYEKTLAVLGPDKQWYNTLKEWYKFQSKTKEKLNAVTGASVGGGDRAIRTLEIDESKFNKGYKLRFESAVEEQNYHTAEVEIPLTKSAITEKASGKGYIRLVKLSKIQ